MKLSKILLCFSLFTFHFSFLFSQEHLLPLKINPVLVRYTNEAKRTHSVVWRIISDSIMAKLPFLDDFSRPGPYPNDSLWMDNAAFVNNTYPICPYTLGVATLDGVNSQGLPYNPSCPIGASYPADSLTSRPMNLSIYQPIDSLYLSFFYQAGGRAPSPPLPADTLLLQFRTSKIPWTTIWYKNGYTPSATDTNFHLVMIPLADYKYFDPNFQFRFKNYACTSANVDQWNIDEVFFDKTRNITDTARADVSFVYECPSLLQNYEYEPWEQFEQNDLRDTMYLQIRNNQNVPIVGINTGENSIINTVPQSNYTGGFSNIQPFSIIGYDGNYAHTHIQIKHMFQYSTITGPTDFTLYNILSLSPGSNFIVWNDTLKFDQTFEDFYAYDDGTSEAAYFINGTPPLYLAESITLNNADTLHGLDLYFDYTFVNPANYYMRLAVWNSDGPGGSPNTLLFEDDSIISPKVSTTLNGFNFYPYHLTNPSALAFNGGATIWVGWIQTEGDSLNIGYDLNTDHHDKICYYDNAFPSYYGTGWNPGTLPGSMMMRPVFGTEKVLSTPVVENSNQSLNIFPNPAGNLVSLSTVMPPNTLLKIMSVDGKEVLSNNHFSGNTINTSSLPSGFYIVEISTPTNKTFYQKLVIER